MTVKKLTDSDKREILDLYRHTGETTSTLADRYGVSNSTISRFLKSTLQEDEYELLIGLKRAARHVDPDEKQTLLFNEVPVAVTQPSPEVKQTVLFSQPTIAAQPIESQYSPEAVEPTPSKEIKKRTTAQQPRVTTPGRKKVIETRVTSKSEDVQDIPLQATFPTNPLAQTTAASSSFSDSSRDTVLADSSSRLLDEQANAEASTIAHMFGEDMLDEDDSDLMDLDDDEDLDELEDEDEDLDEEPFSVRKPRATEALVRVLPLSEASLPRTCYLVIDRAAELITRPLRDFADLGQIPVQEVQQRTLPVFDNHRVARRFSTKRDKVIRVPDSRMLQKACTQLQAKGITRLLVDGQVYSLSPI